MKYLLDTHALLWAEKDAGCLPSQVQAILSESTSELFFSIASLWEMAIKSSLGKLTLPGGNVVATAALLRDLHVRLLEVTPAHLQIVEELPLHHRDPFDRIVVAQAIAEELTLLSVDRAMRKYDVEIFWQ